MSMSSASSAVGQLRPTMGLNISIWLAPAALGEYLKPSRQLAGMKYNLSFAYGNNPESTSFAIATVKVTPGSSATLPAVFFANFSTENNIGWEVFTASFVADSLFTTLSFNEVFGENNGGVLLDAINVTATPLPSTWLMLLSGFVGLGFFAHRATKKRTVALAAA